jgi:hypothetical protein
MAVDEVKVPVTVRVYVLGVLPPIPPLPPPPQPLRVKNMVPMDARKRRKRNNLRVCLRVPKKISIPGKTQKDR